VLRQRPLFWCIVAYVVTLIGFFLTFTHILLVRNALVFVPLTAVAFGAGAHRLYELVGGEGPHMVRWLSRGCPLQHRLARIAASRSTTAIRKPMLGGY